MRYHNADSFPDRDPNQPELRPFDCSACGAYTEGYMGTDCESCEKRICDNCAEQCVLCDGIFCAECFKKHKSVQCCTPGENP